MIKTFKLTRVYNKFISVTVTWSKLELDHVAISFDLMIRAWNSMWSVPGKPSRLIWWSVPGNSMWSVPGNSPWIKLLLYMYKKAIFKWTLLKCAKAHFILCVLLVHHLFQRMVLSNRKPIVWNPENCITLRKIDSIKKGKLRGI